MTQMKKLRAAMAALLVLAAAASASATTFSLSSPGPLGIDVGFGCTAGTVGCSAAPEVLLSGPADATGTFDIVGSGLAMGSLSVVATDVVMTGTVLGQPAVVTFSTLSMDFSGISMLESPLGSGLTAYTQLSSVTGTVDGVATAVLNGIPISVDEVFSFPATLTGLTCSTPTGQCGFNLQFTTTGAAQLDLTFQANLLVPEPATAVLLGLGLLTLVRTRRA